MNLRLAKEFHYGGHTGPFYDTFTSIGDRFFHDFSYGQIGRYFLAGIAIISGLKLIFVTLRGERMSGGFVAAFLLISSLSLSVFLHYLLGVPFLIYRTAIFISPLSMLSLIWLLSGSRRRWLPSVSHSILLVIVLFNLVFSVNFTHLIDFSRYSDIRSAMLHIKAQSIDISGEIRIGKSVYMNAPINYYRERLHMPCIMYSGLEFCKPEGSRLFYLLFDTDLNCVADKPVQFIGYFPISRTYLFSG